MLFSIRNRWSGEAQITLEISCGDDAPFSIKLGMAVRKAVETGANLTRADLTRANLTRADLTGANLTDADLTGADLTGTDLTRANLTRANLTRADLTGANLTDADLTGADLTGTDLTRANLTRANLTRANLTGADLTGTDLTRAYLTRANLTGVRNDLWDVLIRARHEVPGLLAALRSGKVDGSTYQGECACLVGTIANVRHESVDHLGHGLKPNSCRPIERWFMAIRKGDTPEISQVAKITEGWIVEFLDLLAA